MIRVILSNILLSQSIQALNVILEWLDIRGEVIDQSVHDVLIWVSVDYSIISELFGEHSEDVSNICNVLVLEHQLNPLVSVRIW